MLLMYGGKRFRYDEALAAGGDAGGCRKAAVGVAYAPRGRQAGGKWVGERKSH
jgi:hypothetical protein